MYVMAVRPSGQAVGSFVAVGKPYHQAAPEGSWPVVQGARV